MKNLLFVYIGLSLILSLSLSLACEVPIRGFDAYSPTPISISPFIMILSNFTEGEDNIINLIDIKYSQSISLPEGQQFFLIFFAEGYYFSPPLRYYPTCSIEAPKTINVKLEKRGTLEVVHFRNMIDLSRLIEIKDKDKQTFEGLYKVNLSNSIVKKPILVFNNLPEISNLAIEGKPEISCPYEYRQNICFQDNDIKTTSSTYTSDGVRTIQGTFNVNTFFKGIKKLDFGVIYLAEGETIFEEIPRISNIYSLNLTTPNYQEIPDEKNKTETGNKEKILAIPPTIFWIIVGIIGFFLLVILLKKK